MAKTGKLTKQEIFYIKQNPDNMSIQELAKEMDRAPATIAKHYVPIQTPKEDTGTQKEIFNSETEQSKPGIFQLMGHHKRSGKNVATVMTKAASELTDNTRPSRVGGSDKIKSAIHKPMG